MSWEVREGDCLEVMAAMPDESVDAIVTDPPYGLGFMGKEWDALPPGREWAEQCLRVLKPGGHLLAFGGSRTYHRLAVAVEDAGFEIRDQIMWLYGSGFPKSLDVSKALDRAAGAEREITGYRESMGYPDGGVAYESNRKGGPGNVGFDRGPGGPPITAPATEQARKWSGWGTALKPAHEPVVVARKPLVGTVAQNVERFGVGGLNIDGCRVEGKLDGDPNRFAKAFSQGDGHEGWKRPAHDGYVAPVVRSEGRWPANLVLDEQAGAMLDAQSGELTSGANPTRRGADSGRTAYGEFAGQSDANPQRGTDSGGASRFFYTAKASRAERNAGVEQLTEADKGAAKNHHPTVKPIDLMRWLVRLVTPPGGTVLDPFTGSGTTGIAAVLEGFEFIGIEREPEYREIAEARIEWWSQFEGDTTDILQRAGLAEKAQAEHVERGQLDLLGEAA